MFNSRGCPERDGPVPYIYDVEGVMYSDYETRQSAS